ncbi:MAG: ABC transporter ATP-binding protein [Thaumarchaeota archaeon]|jgi:lipoprotein-releasing system ATP-binding protein|nr:ABC transporter ATP-binding protein [Nitrososphaerota archaeon]MBT3743945.1 ABC transporter ATP-binding protein [Nitrososphaerota archaeon]MBT4057310.1 ABC transporter ATP-binding protein [Nitrososphaerota archaeon]MBT4176154.1 ABC transporter ATP-binding protein [Nitrososphaerota archaeon]MBT4510464.1 ABC transporter ATP-binding protein [Nitrososphaerota archaeon]|tara:strand:+ start:932 stop:1636 length:705 start_codon:yes stop_codon:yes gene_type:complete
MSDIVLELQNVSRIFGEGDTQVKALDDVSFRIKRGEFVLIVGSSGSGKSTLLNMIGLLDKPTFGKVILDGKETTTLNDGQVSQYRNEKLGFVFQFANLLPDLTVLENVMLPQQIQGSSEDIRQNATDLLIKVGLEDQINKRSNKISGGQAQRAAIARGLVNRPTVVLADEPTGNLDSVTAGKVVKLAKTMAKELNQTFIIVTHDRHQFPDVDRVITIIDGKAFDGKQTTMEISA